MTVSDSYARTRESAPRAHGETPSALDPPELPHDACIRRDKETSGWVDRYGRDAAKCRADAELAGNHADSLAEVWRSVEAGELYPQQQRIYGPRLLNRLQSDWAKFEKLREQDLKWADALDAVTAWDESQRASTPAGARADREALPVQRLAE